MANAKICDICEIIYKDGEGTVIEIGGTIHLRGNTKEMCGNCYRKLKAFLDGRVGVDIPDIAEE